MIDEDKVTLHVCYHEINPPLQNPTGIGRVWLRLLDPAPILDASDPNLSDPLRQASVGANAFANVAIEGLVGPTPPAGPGGATVTRFITDFTGSTFTTIPPGDPRSTVDLSLDPDDRLKYELPVGTDVDTFGVRVLMQADFVDENDGLETYSYTQEVGPVRIRVPSLRITDVECNGTPCLGSEDSDDAFTFVTTETPFNVAAEVTQASVLPSPPNIDWTIVVLDPKRSGTANPSSGQGSTFAFSPQPKFKAQGTNAKAVPIGYRVKASVNILGRDIAALVTLRQDEKDILRQEYVDWEIPGGTPLRTLLFPKSAYPLAGFAPGSTVSQSLYDFVYDVNGTALTLARANGLRDFYRTNINAIISESPQDWCIRMTSGFRNPARNAAARGRNDTGDGSRHQFMDAFDMSWTISAPQPAGPCTPAPNITATEDESGKPASPRKLQWRAMEKAGEQVGAPPNRVFCETTAGGIRKCLNYSDIAIDSVDHIHMAFTD